MDTSITAVALGLVLIVAATADAQIQVGAALGQSSQAAGDSDSPYLGPPFSGSGLAGVGTIDRAISPRLSLGGEVSLARDITGTQSQRAAGGTNNFVSAHRDTVFSGVVKVGSPSTDRVRAYGVAGGGIAQRRTERTGTFATNFSPTATIQPYHETLTDYVWTLTAGLDIAIGLTDHVAFLGVGRFYQLKDNDRLPDGVVRRGVSSRIGRYGGGLQIRF